MLDQEIKKHLESALNEYTSGDHYNTLLEAKKYYFEVTGIADEEDDDFESRMSSFNNWYILQFISKDSTRTAMKEYVVRNDLDEKCRDSLMSVKYSFFQYTGNSFRKHIVLKDILYGEKVLLPKDHQELAILKEDAFLGRIITFDGKTYLLDGICIVPRESISIIKKEAKKVRRLNDEYEEQQFLFKIEFLKNKWRRYGHLEPAKIFHFKD